jgi:hypothetical protein
MRVLGKCVIRPVEITVGSRVLKSCQVKVDFPDNDDIPSTMVNAAISQSTNSLVIDSHPDR